jgi:hypothetical protein
MQSRTVLLILILWTCLSFPRTGLAIDFYFEPDTAFGEVSETVLLSGRIGPSELMRGFTVYMEYDTNLIHLAEPVLPGSLIVDREGLSFGYFDHDYLPDLLEVYGTVMSPSVDFWAGPGELFQLRFELRMCGDAEITAPHPPFFVDAQGGFPPVTFHPAMIIIGGDYADNHCGSIPGGFGIDAAYPNPFNSSVAIEFSVPRTSHIEITVYDLLGRQIATLVNASVQTGAHNLRWDASGASSGTYLIVLSAPQFRAAKKVVLIR